MSAAAAPAPPITNAKARTKHNPPSWTQEAIARHAALDGRMAYVQPEFQPEIKRKLGQAKELIDDPVPRFLQRLANWWNGDRIERTWALLEVAEVEIVRHSTEDGLRIALITANQRAELALDEKDGHRTTIARLTELSAKQPELALSEVASQLGGEAQQ